MIVYSVVVIQHAGDAIKPKPVEVILLQPKSAVGKQKVEHLSLSIIKTAGIPGRMNPPGTFMEILKQGTVEPAEALHLI